MATPGGFPRLIHQTWKHEHLRWPLSACAASFRTWNPRWEYQLWTDAQCEELVARELPDFLPVYRAYPPGICRADIFRCVVLYLLGGVYADLDVECLQPLDDLLSAAGVDKSCEVLLARDHPLHERKHYGGRAMWMNAFMVAKPRSLFFRTVLEQFERNLRREIVFTDPVNATGPGLFSAVIESCWMGAKGLRVQPLPWRWVHPLPNVFVESKEQPAYLKLIEDRSWRDGAQVPLGDAEEDDLAKGGPPFVAHYWWHSYLENCRITNMLVKYAGVLLQSGGDIVERRLQATWRHLGNGVEAAGRTLAEVAEGGAGACLLLGEPQIPGPAGGMPFGELAMLVFEGLNVPILRLGVEDLNALNGYFSTKVAGLVLSRDALGAGAIVRVVSLLSTLDFAPKCLVLLLGDEDETTAELDRRLRRLNFIAEESVGGRMWSRAQEAAPLIPRKLHIFETDEPITQAERAMARGTWRWHHQEAGWEVKVWDVPALVELLRSHAPDFLDVFLGYPDNATRLSAGRWLVLKFVGGVAVTMATICLRPLDRWVAGATAIVVAQPRLEATRAAGTPVSEAIVGSQMQHQLWTGLEQDLESVAQARPAEAAGGKFLNRRLSESVHWVSRDQWPRITELHGSASKAFSDLRQPTAAAAADLQGLARLLPDACAVPLDLLPESVRAALSGKPSVDLRSKSRARAGQRGGGLRVGITAVDRGDLLLRCVQSIDVPVEKLLIVANQWGPELEPSLAGALNVLRSLPLPRVGSLEIKLIEGHLGTAGSQNVVLSSLGPCLVMGADCALKSGGLEKFLRFVKHRPEAVVHCLYAFRAYFAGRRFLDEIGLFDENFWPWGWDDIDMQYRLAKSGCERAIYSAPGGVPVEAEAVQALNSCPPAMRQWMETIAERNIELGMRKWGIEAEDCGSLDAADRWGIRPERLHDAGNGWRLDLQLRRARLTLLREMTGIVSPVAFHADANLAPERARAEGESPSPSESFAFSNIL